MISIQKKMEFKIKVSLEYLVSLSPTTRAVPHPEVWPAQPAPPPVDFPSESWWDLECQFLVTDTVPGILNLEDSLITNLFPKLYLRPQAF
jgi:hypothetical protein